MVLFGDGQSRCDDESLQLSQAIGAAIGVALENARRYEEARELADLDPLTGLLNHRSFHQRLEEEIARADARSQQLSILMMDIDRFKLLNDTHGHLAGDQVLRQVASLLSAVVRRSDVLARYAGDEFVALLIGAGTAEAKAVAQRFRQALAEHPYLTPDQSAVPIRLSFGIAAFPQDGHQVNELLAFADANLYRAKRQGGDRITVGHLQGDGKHARTSAFGILEGLVTAVDNKDRYTRKHSEDVTRYALQIARAQGLSHENQRTLRIAGLLHDIGKLGVPDRILQKPGLLNDEEHAILRQHALLGEMIIKGVPNLRDVQAAVGSHHERFDGGGYPRKLQGSDIPLLGRILAVADAYSAMTTDRPYRKAMRPEEAQRELQRVAGSQLDPELVKTFLSCLAQKPPGTHDAPLQKGTLATPFDHSAVVKL
jgi:diguanylate cyclase (GGDEF)-like protein/putative nucleotidyltransferase with HDIG domain